MHIRWGISPGASLKVNSAGRLGIGLSLWLHCFHVWQVKPSVLDLRGYTLSPAVEDKGKPFAFKAVSPEVRTRSFLFAPDTPTSAARAKWLEAFQQAQEAREAGGEERPHIPHLHASTHSHTAPVHRFTDTHSHEHMSEKLCLKYA